MTPLTDDEELDRYISWHGVENGRKFLFYDKCKEASEQNLPLELRSYMRFEGTEEERLVVVSKMCDEMIAHLDELNGVTPLPKLRKEVVTGHLGAQRMEKAGFGPLGLTATFVFATIVLTGSLLL